jgi:sulfatase modifying factor 1
MFVHPVGAQTQHCDMGISAARAAMISASAAPAPKPDSAAHSGMMWIPGGEFSMGSDHPDMADARPVHLVHVDGFWIDPTDVTNAVGSNYSCSSGVIVEQAA